MPSKLFLLRHLKSRWNQDHEFAGWVDNPLSSEGIAQAKEIGERLGSEELDVIYTSPLIRNQETIVRVFEYIPNRYPLFIHIDGGRMERWGHFTDLNDNDIPAYVSEKLNERYYGKLQGLNKDKIAQQYGQEQAHQWRRSWNVRPPGGESLKDVYARAVPFFTKHIEKDLAQGKNVLVVASHNSLRTIVKYIENISDEEVSHFELPFGAFMTYEYDKGYTKL